MTEIEQDAFLGCISARTTTNIIRFTAWAVKIEHVEDAINNYFLENEHEPRICVL